MLEPPPVLDALLPMSRPGRRGRRTVRLESLHADLERALSLFERLAREDPAALMRLRDQLDQALNRRVLTGGWRTAGGRPEPVEKE